MALLHSLDTADVRPGHLMPTTVQHVLAGDISDAVVQRLMDALRADPDWLVLEPFGPASECIVQMVYQPTGRPYGFPAVRLDSETWRFAATTSWWARAARA